MGTCSECGEDAVMVDSHYCEEQAVCTNCGHVIKSYVQSFSYEVSQEERGTYVRQAKPSTQHITHGVKADGMKHIKVIVSQLKLSKVVEEEAKDLYMKCHLTHGKVAVAAACVFMVVQRHRLPVTLDSISAVTPVTWEELHNRVRLVKDKFKFNIVSPSARSVAESYLSRAEFPASNAFDDEKKRVMQRAMQILELCEEGSTLKSFAPEVTLNVVTYIAWVSFDPKKRVKSKIKQFCSDHNLSFTRSSYGHLNAYRRMVRAIIKLGNEIPWLMSCALNFKTIYYHLDTVLEFRRQLTKSCSDKEKEVESFGEIESVIRKTFGEPQPLPNSVTVDPQSLPSSVSADPKPLPSSVIVGSVDEFNGRMSQGVELHKYKESDDNDCCESLSDVELTDEEMHMYLRTPRQIELVQTLRRNLEEKES